MSIPAFLICASVLSAPAFPVSPPSSKHFQCSDGTDFRLSTNGKNALVRLDDDLEISLAENNFSFGKRYTNNEMTLIVDGNRAVVALLAADDVITCVRTARKKGKK